MKNVIRTLVMGVLQGPRWVSVWVLVGLMGANVIAPLFFWNTIEAQIVLGTISCSAVFMFLLCARFGFTRILGLGHILWIPLIAYLIIRWENYPLYTLFGAWLRGVVLINGVSLVMDGSDVLRFIKGERESMDASVPKGEAEE